LRYSQHPVNGERLPLPDQQNRQLGYRLAYKLAADRLAKMDPEQLCRRSGARLELADGKAQIILKLLNQPYRISLPDIAISAAGSPEPVPTRIKLLLLHYLTRAGGGASTGKVITYKELPEGANYFPVFSQRAIKPLLDNFAREPEKLLDAAAKLGGSKADYGDVAVTISAFPRVPLTIVLWRGDDELAPEGSILFDSSISDYLSAEDIAVLCETISWKLVGISGQSPSGGR
jgi:hypothetical protein